MKPKRRRQQTVKSKTLTKQYTDTVTVQRAVHKPSNTHSVVNTTGQRRRHLQTGVHQIMRQSGPASNRSHGISAYYTISRKRQYKLCKPTLQLTATGQNQRPDRKAKVSTARCADPEPV